MAKSRSPSATVSASTLSSSATSTRMLSTIAGPVTAGQQLLQGGRAHRPPEQVALGEPVTGFVQLGGLAGGLDALGHGLDAEVAGEPDQVPHDDRAGPARGRAADEGLVDLE